MQRVELPVLTCPSNFGNQPHPHLPRQISGTNRTPTSGLNLDYKSEKRENGIASPCDQGRNRISGFACAAATCEFAALFCPILSSRVGSGLFLSEGVGCSGVVGSSYRLVFSLGEGPGTLAHPPWKRLVYVLATTAGGFHLPPLLAVVGYFIRFVERGWTILRPWCPAISTDRGERKTEEEGGSPKCSHMASCRVLSDIRGDQEAAGLGGESGYGASQ